MNNDHVASYHLATLRAHIAAALVFTVKTMGSCQVFPSLARSCHPVKCKSKPVGADPWPCTERHSLPNGRPVDHRIFRQVSLQSRQDGLQFLDVDWFHEACIKTRFDRHALFLIVHIAGHRYKRGLFETRLTAQASR